MPEVYISRMTRMRAAVISLALVMGFTFGGCFPDGGGDDCKSAAAAGPIAC